MVARVPVITHVNCSNASACSAVMQWACADWRDGGGARWWCIACGWCSHCSRWCGCCQSIIRRRARTDTQLRHKKLISTSILTVTACDPWLLLSVAIIQTRNTKQTTVSHSAVNTYRRRLKASLFTQSWKGAVVALLRFWHRLQVS